jgi:hypothetical protein
MRLNISQQLASRWNGLTLRQQLVISLWLCTIPISTAGSAIVLGEAYRYSKQAAHQSMSFNLATLAQVMNYWLSDSQAWLTELAASPRLRNLNPANSAERLKLARQAYPEIDLSVYDNDGQLIASNAAIPPPSTAQAAKDRRRASWFQQALKGKNTVELWQLNHSNPSRTSTSACCSRAHHQSTSSGEAAVEH